MRAEIQDKASSCTCGYGAEIPVLSGMSLRHCRMVLGVVGALSFLTSVALSRWVFGFAWEGLLASHLSLACGVAIGCWYAESARKVARDGR